MPTSLPSSTVSGTPSTGGTDALIPAPIDFIDGLFVAAMRPVAGGGSQPVSEYHLLANNGAFIHSQGVRADDPRLLGNLAAITGTYTQLANDGYIAALITAASAVTLLPGSAAVRDVTIVNRYGSTANLSVTASGSTIEGPAISLAPGAFARLVYVPAASVWVRIG